MGSSSFPPWVDSNLWVRIEPPSRACHSLRGQTDKSVSIDHGSSSCSCPYFVSPNNPGAYSLARTCSYPRHHLQIWCLIWCQYGFPISLGWEHHLLSPIFPYPDVPPPLIFCGPGVWRFLRICSYSRRLVDKGRGSRHALHCDVQLRGICWGI